MNASKLPPAAVPTVATGPFSPAVALSGIDRHALDLAHVFRASGEGMPDALVIEIRRHLFGMMATVESAMVFDLMDGSPLKDHAALLEKGLCEAVIPQSPHLLSPALFQHFRARAAFSLLVRQDYVEDGRQVALPGDDFGWLLDDPDAQIVRMATGLMLAENRWSDLTGGTGQIPADLPADLYAELCWIVGAILSKALDRGSDVPSPVVQGAVVDSVHRLLSRYDEERGPVARAAQLARALLARPDSASNIQRALAQRRYLLLAAMAAERASVPLDRLMPVLIQGNTSRLLAMFRILACDPADVAIALNDLQVARGATTVQAAAALAAEYQRMDEDDARTQLLDLALPIEFSAKCALLAGDGA